MNNCDPNECVKESSLKEPERLGGKTLEVKEKVELNQKIGRCCSISEERIRGGRANQNLWIWGGRSIVKSVTETK